MIKKMFTKLFSGGMLFIMGFLSALYISNSESKQTGGRIETKVISGEKIEQKKWNFRGNDISFQTHAAGKGVAETRIPKTLIPEARNWINKKHLVSTGICSTFSEEKTNHGIFFQYYYRFESVGLGGGLILVKSSPGAMFGFSYIF